MEKIRIFSKQDETVNLLIGLVFLAFSPLVMIYAPLNRLQSVRVNDVFNLLFLAHVHVLFTFPVLYQIPEAREFVKRKFNGGSRIFFHGVIVFVFACVLKYAFYGAKHGLLIKPRLFLLLVNLLMQLHAQSQMKGLSLLYNHAIKTKIELAADQLSFLQRSQQWEKNIFAFAFVLSCLARATKFIFPVTMASIVVSVCIAGTVAAFLSLLWNAHLVSRKVAPSGKIIYLLRFALIPLNLVHLEFGFILTAIHGVEYFFVTRKIYRNSKCQQIPTLLGVGTLAAVLGLVVAFFRMLATHADLQPFDGMTVTLAATLAILGPALGAVTLVHIYFDGFLFRFSDPLVRETMGPLLTQAAKAPPVAVLEMPSIAEVVAAK